jgi:VanZ family protein
LLTVRFRLLWIIIGWAFVLGVTYGSLMPSPPDPLTCADADKVEHVTAYLVLMLWFAQLYTATAARWRVAVGLVALGVLIEILQGWSGYRDFEYLDMVADTAGVSLGWALVWSPLGRTIGWVDSAVGWVLGR